MRDLAGLLADDTTAIEQDVEDIYNFEKNISRVNTFVFIVMYFFSMKYI